MTTVEIRHFHLFCGLGGGARGFNRGQARVGSMVARFRCLGGVDVSPAAIRDFERLAGVPGTCLDLFDRDQYRSFHGQEPPAGWREAGPDDIRKAAGGERPHIVFLSAPCKGFSGLLSESRSRSERYQALNRLTLRGVWLMLEAWPDDPPELIVFENVPRIASRGRALLDQITALLRSYGYAVAETTHDCGELGGLAQSRKRFLLVARHREKVPAFLYEPLKRRLRAVGDVLERLPLPGMGLGGPMHRLPALQWRTWVRLAFVEAGSDWRSLSRLRVEDGVLADYLIVPEHRADYLGVRRWDRPCGAVSGRGGPTNGSYAVADPRFDGHEYGQFGVRLWSEPMGAVSAQSAPGGGRYSVADPRMSDNKSRHLNLYRVVAWDAASKTIIGATRPGSGAMTVADPRTSGIRHNNVFRVTSWAETAPAVTGGTGPSAGGTAVADPRLPGPVFGKGKVTPFDAPAVTVIAGSTTGQGAFAVADPRAHELRKGAFGVRSWNEPTGTVAGESFPTNGAFAVADPRCGMERARGDNYLTGGHFGVVPWESPSGAVSAAACHDNGRWSVADPRVDEVAALPAPDDRLVAVIRAMDGTWHRPFSTLELAALQGLVDPEEQFELDGLSDSAWRERIGNAVPPPAAQAIAGVMGEVLLLTWSGETFAMGCTPIWVRPAVAALMAARGEE